MAYDAVVDSAALDGRLGAIADAIRAQTGGGGLLSLEDMAVSIGGIKNADGYLADVIDKRITRLVNDRITGSLPTRFQNGNKNLVEVDLPHATELAEAVFGACSSLVAVNLPSVVRMNASNFSGAAALKAVRFEELTTITGYGYTFNNSGVEKVVFDKLAQQFGPYDFSNCRYLTSLVLGGDAVVPLTASNAFGSTPIANGAGYIYVRAALVDAYKSASNWSTLAAQFRAIEDYPGIMEV